MPDNIPNKKRASAIIFQNDKLLVIRRVKPDGEYYTLPGGTWEEGETIEQTMLREIREELSVEATIDKLLFEIKAPDREDYFLLIKGISGSPRMGGPELERVSDDNQYILEWVDLQTFKATDNFYPNPKEIQS